MSNTNPITNRVLRISSTCSTSGTRRVTIVKKQRFYNYYTFHSRSKVLNNNDSSYPKMCVKRPLVYSWVVLFTFVDKRYICASLCYLVNIISFPIADWVNDCCFMLSVLYHRENTTFFNDIMVIMTDLYQTNTVRLIFHNTNNSPNVDMSL